MDEQKMASNYLQTIVISASREGSPEIQRQNAIHHIETALTHGDYNIHQTLRLRRLVSCLESCSRDSAERKLSVVRDQIVPAIISLGLAEEV